MTCNYFVWQNGLKKRIKPPLPTVNTVRGFRITRNTKLQQTCRHINRITHGLLCDAVHRLYRVVIQRSRPDGQTRYRHIWRSFLLLREEQLKLSGLTLPSHLYIDPANYFFPSGSSTAPLFEFPTSQCVLHVQPN